MIESYKILKDISAEENKKPLLHLVRTVKKKPILEAAFRGCLNAGPILLNRLFEMTRIGECTT
jgi:hypothetical protein